MLNVIMQKSYELVRSCIGKQEIGHIFLADQNVASMMSKTREWRVSNVST